MARLVPITFQSPGVLGLNTENGDDVLDPRYATQAWNCVTSRNGRLESRKGWQKINGTAAAGAPDLEVVHSYVTDSGTEVLISTGGNKLWTGDTTLTDSTGSVNVTANNWQFQNQQGNVYGVQDSHEPVVWDGTGNFEYLVDQNTQWAAGIVKSLGDLVIPTTRNGYFYECTTAGTTDGSTEPTWPTTVGDTVVDNTATWTCRELPKSNTCLAAYGRLWITDGTVVYYSDLLIPHAHDTGSTENVGSSGRIDLDTVWVTSNDTVTSLAIHNNNLVILCDKSIVIYSGADNVSNLAVVEVIDRIGCVERDSVQSVGNDMFWLSHDGVRALSRTVLQDNMPLSTITENIRTDIVSYVQQETTNKVRSAYNEQEGLYLLIFPVTKVVLAIDMRSSAQGVFKHFLWDSIEPLCVESRRNKDLIFSFSGGFLGKYNGYLDDTSTYIFKYRSGWIDPGTNGVELVFKKMLTYLSTNYGFIGTGAWSYDFSAEEDTETRTVTASNISEYNVSEYNVDEYGSGITSTILSYGMKKTGEVVKMGFQATVNSGRLGINKIMLQAKPGRIR